MSQPSQIKPKLSARYKESNGGKITCFLIRVNRPVTSTMKR